MSYLRFEDQADGVHVFFDGRPRASFIQTDIATLSRASAHTIRLMINFKSGDQRRQGLHRQQEG